MVQTDDRPEELAPLDARPPRPALLSTLALVVAVAVCSSAVTVWWVHRRATPNAADVGFYEDMSTHHEQALAMAGVYQHYGTDPVLREIAGEISLSQAGDIRQMQQSLVDWHKTSGAPAVAMRWMGMTAPENLQPGMATPAQMAELEAARGRRLDDLFSRLMLDHHEAGAEMSEAAARRAHVALTRERATAMARGQRSEIGDLELRRSQLGLPRYVPPRYMGT